MKKKTGLIIAITLAVALIIGAYGFLSSKPQNKIEKTLTRDTQFYIFGYDNQTDLMPLNEEVVVDKLEWNPESVGLVFETNNGTITAIFDGLEAKLQFIEMNDANGNILSHFVFNNTIKMEEGSPLKAYLEDIKVNEIDFIEYIETTFNDNNLRKKFDAYKIAFSKNF